MILTSGSYWVWLSHVDYLFCWGKNVNTFSCFFKMLCNFWNKWRHCEFYILWTLSPIIILGEWLCSCFSGNQLFRLRLQVLSCRLRALVQTSVELSKPVLSCLSLSLPLVLQEWAQDLCIFIYRIRASFSNSLHSGILPALSNLPVFFFLVPLARMTVRKKRKKLKSHHHLAISLSRAPLQLCLLCFSFSVIK